MQNLSKKNDFEFLDLGSSHEIYFDQIFSFLEKNAFNKIVIIRTLPGISEVNLESIAICHANSEQQNDAKLSNCNINLIKKSLLCSGIPARRRNSIESDNYMQLYLRLLNYCEMNEQRGISCLMISIPLTHEQACSSSFGNPLNSVEEDVVYYPSLSVSTLSNSIMLISSSI
ncbi:hypothetical protein [Xenorhabdus bovienii]|uniref:hypothetical protein n=1 Tax=Xenorhabdus bovienii TaxID=40576 RepID=UPI0023B32EF9|nr:hypothetical protein [Xenorhabdus bovienii]MDE9453242.1 hypothetical protein [Xenorhabdus bovienii]